MVNNQNQFMTELKELREKRSNGTNSEDPTEGNSIGSDDKLITYLENKWMVMTNLIVFLAAEVNNLQQYSRMNNLLLHNLPNMPIGDGSPKGTAFSKVVAERINTMMTLEEPVSHRDIDTSHYNKKPVNKDKNVVIVRFKSRDLRDEIWFNKSQLKKLNVSKSVKTSVIEHLTNYNLALLEAAKTKLGKSNAWSNKCRIFTKLNNSIVQLKTENDILEVSNKKNPTNGYLLPPELSMNLKDFSSAPAVSLQEAMRMLNVKKSRK